MQQVGTLQDNRVIGTVATNYGLEASLSKLGIDLRRVPVGDKHIIDALIDKGAGISSEEDTFAPLKKIANRRIFWLGINLLTVILASFFIGIFQRTLDEIVALAILMPIVASMGGIAGIQSMTMMVRAQALGRITPSNIRWLFTREGTLGFINGIIWSIVVSVLSYLWFQNAVVSIALVSSLILNMMLGATLGVFLPTILERFKIDPANAGGALLTTVTDVFGFVAFLGIASLLHDVKENLDALKLAAAIANN